MLTQGQHPDSQRLVRALPKKKPYPIYSGRVKKIRQRLTLPGIIPVPSAHVGLTALFGMGRGVPHRYSHLKIFGD